ncbi:MAG: hypothetical protein EPO20_14970 [Betaproteobacteria bacterium]|nr:MAG: hypothetical protein EPO20_14970 [Betaproteobacteria bacterium]
MTAHTPTRCSMRRQRSNLSRSALYDRAQALHIPGRSKMAKADLIDAIQKAS